MKQNSFGISLPSLHFFASITVSSLEFSSFSSDLSSCYFSAPPPWQPYVTYIYTCKEYVSEITAWVALCKNLLLDYVTHRSLQILFTLEDGLVIETVIIPCDRGRNTVCVSSQVGCAMNCQFCYTGRQASIKFISCYIPLIVM